MSAAGSRTTQHGTARRCSRPGVHTKLLRLRLCAVVLHIGCFGDDARNARTLRLAARAESLRRPGCRDCARHVCGCCGRVGGVGRGGAGIDLGKLRPAVRSRPSGTQAAASSSYCRYRTRAGASVRATPGGTSTAQLQKCDSTRCDVIGSVSGNAGLRDRVR
jgi:hypothetical protein